MADLHLYRYAAHVTDCYDGDTITAELQLGFHLTLADQKIRLYGINTPEVRGDERPAGLTVRDWLREQILDRDVVIRTYRDRTGRYGRWLGVIFLPDGDGWRNINAELIDSGMAEMALYGDTWHGWPAL